ncbi:MAG: hypothetical protein ABIY70_11610 [Capsulimonas sp.]|uniref:hypothetical protein n=1 Tax=Capsulimonas sp. TaxID=2494211 RepID=UPI003265AA4B
MDMPVPTRSLIDFVLRKETPVWRQWNGNVSELLRLLQESAIDLKDMESSPDPFDRIQINYHRRALIDRLLGNDGVSYYRDLLEARMKEGIFENVGREAPRPWPTAKIVYYWVRRLDPEDRPSILEFLQIAGQQLDPDNDEAVDEYNAIHKSARIGWGQSSFDEYPAKLLDWREICEANKIAKPTNLESGIYVWEYRLKDTNPRVRVTQVLSILAEISSEKITYWDNPYGGLDHVLRDQLTKDLAVLITPDQSKLPGSEDALWRWFLSKVVNILEQDEIHILLRSDIRRRLRNDIREIWVLAHDQSTWKPLYDAFDILHAGYVSFSAIERFGSILPQDRPELWEKLFALGSLENFVMQAYCTWLPSEKYHELIRFFDGDAVGPEWEHFDRAVCAYQSYLHRAPLEELKQESDRIEGLPQWRLMLLDRFLYAPEPLKPGPVAWDIQEIEGNDSLTDPLDVRGY